MIWKKGLKILMSLERGRASSALSRRFNSWRKSQKLAITLLKQAQPQINIPVHRELFDLLGWSALLHEVGQSISFQGYHRHSAYLLKHTAMPGFNAEQQRLLSLLARNQRKAIKLRELPNSLLPKNR